MRAGSGVVLEYPSSQKHRQCIALAQNKVRLRVQWVLATTGQILSPLEKVADGEPQPFQGVFSYLQGTQSDLCCV